MAIKTTGVDHIHVLVPSLDSFLELFDRLFESEHTMQSEVESVQGFNSTLRFHDATSTPFLDVFEPATEDGIVARMSSREMARASRCSPSASRTLRVRPRTPNRAGCGWSHDSAFPA